ncbi:hypothetical protein QTO34_008303, partial [Cnephaeus nilssonii]
MSLLPSRAASLPGPSGWLCSLLALLLLLTLPGPLASAGPSMAIVSELRCVCLAVTHKIHPKMISHLEVVAAGPGCPNVEIIATLVKGTKSVWTQKPLWSRKSSRKSRTVESRKI